MQKIIPNLWFDGNAKEAVEFYMSVFSDAGAKITSTSYYPTEGLADFQKPMAGKELTVNFEIGGLKFTAINADSTFKPNPSISFFVNCETKEEVDTLWEKLSSGGEALMPLDKYPFSDWYGWVADKYGISWQIILAKPEGDWRPKIIPSFLFTGKKAQAEDVLNFYKTVFGNVETGQMNYYDAGQMPEMEGMVMFADFTIEGQWFASMDGGDVHDFTFNEAISLSVQCEDQEEIDALYEKLSAVPESEICGWLKDKFGVSWQVVPKNIEELMQGPGGSFNPKAFAAMMKMKKLDIAELERAAEGK